MIRITAIARCLSQINKKNADLLPKNWADNLPKKLLPQLNNQKNPDPGTQNSLRYRPQNTIFFATKTAKAPNNREERHISSVLGAYTENGCADGDIHLNHEIEVKQVGELVRIKPSEERGHMKEAPLTKVDQIAVPIMMKTIHLYKSPPKGSIVNEVVSESLSKVLSHYYPLAGKLGINTEKELVVNCKDEGVMLKNAKANCVLDDVLSSLDHVDTMQKFFYDIPWTNILEIPLMTVQVTRFQCGGFAVGIAMSHCMCDGTSLAEFFKNWGQIARCGLLDMPPFLDRNVIIHKHPPTTPHPTGFLQLKETTKTESVYDDQPLEDISVVFDEERILKLKKMATKEGSGVSNCSTFDAVTAFLWRARTKAFNVHSNKEIKVLFSMDVRSMFDDPPLPEGFFGNVVVITHAFCTAGELLENEFSYGVKLIQDAKRMVNVEYARSFINCSDPIMFDQSLTTTFNLSSWLKLAFDEMDFGLGKAVYAGPAMIPIRGAAGYSPFGKNKKGVIVKMGMPQSVMEDFEKFLM